MTNRKPGKAQPGKLNSVRIIGGAWRGRRVRFPDAPGLRPTPDRVRETLFNWLQPVVAGARCLDLFAGSGALGLEALSRGAAQVVFVEQAPEAARMLEEQLELLSAGRPAGRIVRGSAERFLAAPAPATPAAPFDVVFLDPPFGLDALGEYAARIEAGGWVRGGGWIYLEGARSAGPPAVPARWQLVHSKSAGEVGYHLARVASN